MTNGVCCISSDIGVAAWPPAISTPQNTMRLTPTNGYAVESNRWIKVSGDLITFQDWIRIRPFGSNIIVEHRASPIRPYLFMSYPTVNTNTPPIP
jgi:hypothetical protein